MTQSTFPQKLDKVNFAVSGKEAGCDDIDMNDEGNGGDGVIGKLVNY